MVLTNTVGRFALYSTTGSIDTNNPFFQPLGTNGRTCATCHLLSDGMSISAPTHTQQIFGTTGLDPLFNPVDAAVNPNDDVSTVNARRLAYALLLNDGLFRFDMPVPPTAEFTVTSVTDPYDYATADRLSVFRRPLASVNLAFLSSLMWDTRESSIDKTIRDQLITQANDANLLHAQAGQDLDPITAAQIADFQLNLFSSQVFLTPTLALTTTNQGLGGPSGPVNLSNTPYYFGVNDPFGNNPTGTPFTSTAFSNFSAWATAAGLKASIYRGQVLFNTHPITLTNVRGLNDVLGQPVFIGTCSTCHDVPNVGSHSIFPGGEFDIQLTNLLRENDQLPQYTLTCISSGQVITTSDPGMALITGKCADIAKFKVPSLRNLAARAPYFHNASATTLRAVLQHYETHFNLTLSIQDENDLINFLNSL